jgi:DNA-binding HxlR family transcriptional regulator
MKASRSDCPIAATLDVVGDRWSLVILRDLLMIGKRRYRDFLGGSEAIATNVLADRLARLEECGIISKSRDPEDRRQFVYAPTKKGLDFLPVLFQLIRWGLKYVEGTQVPIPRERLLRDEKSIEREIRARFRRSA